MWKMTTPNPNSMNRDPPKKPMEWLPPEKRTEWRHHPEFRFAQSMKNEVQPSMVTIIRYLRRNARQMASVFDSELAENLLETADHLENVWDFLVKYQEDYLIPLYAELFPGKTVEEEEESS